MDITAKTESRSIRAVLSCDSFTTGYIVVCLLFGVPYIVSSCGAIAPWFLPIACLLPFVVMPLFYMIIHRFDLLLFGRYHLAMPLSAFVSALFFVIMFGATDGGAASACMVFFGATVFIPALLIYRYCAFSVRARLLDDKPVTGDAYSRVFGAIGAAAALGTIAGFFYYDDATAYINTAYVLGGACIVLAMVHYLTTYYGIPRLGGRRNLPFKAVFRTFYEGLNVKTYLSSLFFEAAFVALAALVTVLAHLHGVEADMTVIFGATLVAAYFVASKLCVRFIKHRNKALSIIDLVSAVLAAGLLALISAVEMNAGWFYFCLAVSTVAIGVGGAVCVRQTKLRLATIKQRITGGVMFILGELMGSAAFAVAITVAAGTLALFDFTSSAYSLIFGFAFAAVLAVAAFVLAGKLKSGSARPPRVSYEPSTAELERASYNPEDASETEAGNDTPNAQSADA